MGTNERLDMSVSRVKKLVSAFQSLLSDQVEALALELGCDWQWSADEYKS